jgi:hypothetical protein
VSSVSNGLYVLTLPLVSVMRVIKRNTENVWGARYTLGALYLPKNTVFIFKLIFPAIWYSYKLVRCKCVEFDYGDTGILHTKRTLGNRNK